MSIIAKNFNVGSTNEMPKKYQEIKSWRSKVISESPKKTSDISPKKVLDNVQNIIPTIKTEKYIEANHVKYNKDSIFYKDSPYVRELLGN